MAYQLLDAYGFDYIKLGHTAQGVARKALKMILMDAKLLRVARPFKPDVYFSVGSPYAAQVSRITGGTHIAFVDTEHNPIVYPLTIPFTDVICTPDTFRKDLGERQLRYRGQHELAYLHPNWFRPDPSILDYTDIGKDERFVVMRFVSWDAIHDVGEHGFNAEAKLRTINEIEEYARVVVTSEGPLPPDLESYRLRIPTERLHDLLYYADLYLGDGGTTASEAGMLGTPSILVNTLAKYCGVFDSLGSAGLLYTYDNPLEGLTKAVELLETNAKKEGLVRRDRWLRTRIDVTRFMLELAEAPV